MEEEPVVAEEYGLENSNQFKKARKLVENKDIKAEEIRVDDIKFRINGNKGEHILHYNPQTKESVCNCKGYQYNEGDCYHRIAAETLLTQKMNEGWKLGEKGTAYFDFKDDIGEGEAVRQVQIEDTSLVIDLDEDNTLLGIETYSRKQDLPDNILQVNQLK